MPFPRLRIQTLMLLVLLSALPMASIAMLKRRAQRFEELAALHRREAGVFGVSDLEWFLVLTPAQGDARPLWRQAGDSESDWELVRSAAAYEAYHCQVSWAYEEAAKRPWTSPVVVSPAPPVPLMTQTKAVFAKALARIHAVAGSL